MKKQFIIALSLLMILLLSYPAYSRYERGYGDEGEYSAKYYDNAKVIRVKYVRGEAFVNRDYNEGVEEATVNLSIFEGDSAGTTDGRMEVYLGKLNYLRLDYDTEIKFTKVPALRRTRTTLQLRKGGIYLDISNIDDERDIVIQTEDCGLFILRRGLYRINARENGQTEVYVYDGLAEVAGNDYSRNVRENQKVVMREGRVLERPFYFYSSDTDDFDQWNKTRTNLYEHSRYSSSRYLNRGYEAQEHELTRSGRWQYNRAYSTYVWSPYNVSRSWRPYSNGRWVWNPRYGYVWNSYDSWGYYTHHYGRWQWSGSYGWYWLPGYRWSPAWVSWYGDSSYWGWCPLSYYNTPVVVLNGRWNRNYRYRTGIPWNSRSMIVIRKNQLMAPRINNVLLRRGALSRITKRNIKYRGTAPRTSPVIRTVSVINARGRRVAYKRNGVVSYKRYGTSARNSVYKRVNGRTLRKSRRKNSLKNSVFKYSSRRKVGRTAPSYKSSSGLKHNMTKRYNRKTSYKRNSLKSGVTNYKYKSSQNKRYLKPKASYKYKSSGNRRYSSPKTTYKKSNSFKKTKKKKNSPSYGYNSRRSNSRYAYKPYKSNSHKSNYRTNGYNRSSYSSKYKSKNNYGYSSKKYRKPLVGTVSRYNYKSKSYTKPSYRNKSYSLKTYRRPSYKSSSSYKSKSRSPLRNYKSYSKTTHKSRNYNSKSYRRPAYKSSSNYKSKSYRAPLRAYNSSSSKLTSYKSTSGSSHSRNRSSSTSSSSTKSYKKK